MPKNINSFLQLFIQKGLPFVLYRLPGGQEPVFVAQKTNELEKRKLSEIDMVNGFLLAEFSKMKSETFFFIRPDIVINDGVFPQELQNELEELPDVSETLSKPFFDQSKEDYLLSAQKIIDKLKSGEFQKVVLSRISQTETGRVNKGKLFSELEQKYPNAFVYLMHLPRMGTWTGATPETLLKVGNAYAKTVALAGTQPVDQVKWTDKEREEQQIVTDFIEEALVEEGVGGFQKFGPFTLRAGKLAHLKTTFQIPIEQLKGRTGNLIARLHPTPAVCGLPKESAFKLIQETEKHDRGLYTGFLGPWSLNGKSQLFVNLRCARLEENSASLFVGGGITASSSAEAEWEETVNKAETLLSVLKNL